MRKRFIAGAVCPQCHSQDTLAVGREDEQDVVVCVRCGYRQRQPEAGQKPEEAASDRLIGIFRPQ
ncbi:MULTISPECIES: YheV family putative zinc ribbon protein [Musicola]|uniref:Uncharacterized protein n=1 Tax=Musicola paradisiaca (strain Ech703) TaxID=579405 RepID=C6C847_MUSP7|nr:MULTISPECIES: YheV family putative zinc ribbon protein [Musicola]ACS84192.1 conserved hypothetical protein [Musicola paradisiaca Ech703]